MIELLQKNEIAISTGACPVTLISINAVLLASKMRATIEKNQINWLD